MFSSFFSVLYYLVGSYYLSFLFLFLRFLSTTRESRRARKKHERSSKSALLFNRGFCPSRTPLVCCLFFLNSNIKLNSFSHKEQQKKKVAYVLYVFFFFWICQPSNRRRTRATMIRGAPLFFLILPLTSGGLRHVLLHPKKLFWRKIKLLLRIMNMSHGLGTQREPWKI